MLIDGKEYTSLPLDNFGDIDAILKEQAIGRASEEQGGNRESQAKRKSYNTDRDPLNEDWDKSKSPSFYTQKHTITHIVYTWIGILAICGFWVDLTCPRTNVKPSEYQKS